MRSILASIPALGLLIALGVSASAAPVHRPRARSHTAISPSQGVTSPAAAPTPGARFAVPGWSDESTRRWLDNASSLVGVGG
jgi:hypothetical protein